MTFPPLTLYAQEEDALLRSAYRDYKAAQEAEAAEKQVRGWMSTLNRYAQSRHATPRHAASLQYIRNTSFLLLCTQFFIFILYV